MLVGVFFFLQTDESVVQVAGFAGPRWVHPQLSSAAPAPPPAWQRCPA